MASKPMNAGAKNEQPVQFQKARQCGARTKSGDPCRSPATKKGRCRLHGGASGSGGPPGKRNGQYRHGERTKAAIAEQRKFSALLKMLRAGYVKSRGAWLLQPSPTAAEPLAMCYPGLAGDTLRGRPTPRFSTIQVCPKDLRTAPLQAARAENRAYGPVGG